MKDKTITTMLFILNIGFVFVVLNSNFLMDNTIYVLMFNLIFLGAAIFFFVLSIKFSRLTGIGNLEPSTRKFYVSAIITGTIVLSMIVVWYVIKGIYDLF